MFLSIKVLQTFKTLTQQENFFQSLNKLFILRQKFQEYGFSVQYTHM